MRLRFHNLALAFAGAWGLALAGASTGQAFTLPPFTPDITTSGLSVAISSKVVTPKVGPSSLTASFTLNTPFSSMDFPDSICSPPATTFILGVAPSKNCKTGEATLTPLTIPLSQVTNTDCETFTFPGSNLTANWSVSSYTPPASGGGNSSVSCINGVCTVYGSGGTSIITTSGGSTIVVQSNSGNSQSSANQKLAFSASSTTPGVIVVPTSKVDAFILYNSEDMGSGYAGTCVTLNSTSISSQSKSINGSKTVTQSFAAH